MRTQHGKTLICIFHMNVVELASTKEEDEAGFCVHCYVCLFVIQQHCSIRKNYHCPNQEYLTGNKDCEIHWSPDPNPFLCRKCIATCAANCKQWMRLNNVSGPGTRFRGLDGSDVIKLNRLRCKDNEFDQFLG